MGSPLTICEVCDETRNEPLVEPLVEHLVKHHLNVVMHIEVDPSNEVAVIRWPA